MVTTPPPPSIDEVSEVARPHDSMRDPATLTAALQTWLAGRLPDDATPVIEHLTPPSGNGLSSETILCDAIWTSAGERRRHELVVRVAPLGDSMPVFSRYDMRAQFDTMRVVHEQTDVPVPAPYWIEDGPDVLGAPFFVMARVDGVVPPDVLPYNWDSWVSQAGSGDRARMERSTVEVIAALHAMTDPQQRLPVLTGADSPDALAALRAHIAGQRAYYEWATAQGPRSPLLERCLDFVAAHPPAVPGPAVLCWGDSRIGNVIYRDFTPAAVLDWEMATFGPRELDLGWLVFMHEFFQDIAANAGLDGLPDMLRRDIVAATYTEISGLEVHNLDFFVFYAALRHAIIMFRIQSRAIAFGTATVPEDPDDMILHRKMLETMLTKEMEI